MRSKVSCTVLRGGERGDSRTSPDSTRRGVHPEVSNRMAYLLKRQKGKCSHCGLTFQEWDVIEDDHVIPKALGGKDEWKNRQLLHRHCHDEKTRTDLIEIRKMDTSKFRDGENTNSCRNSIGDGLTISLYVGD